MSEIVQLWSHALTWLSGQVVAPALLLLHIQDAAGSPDEVAEACLITLIQIGIIGLIFRPLESLIPAERWEDRKLTRIDRLYTLLMLLGLFPLFSYLVLAPLGHWFGGGGAESAGGESAFGLKYWVPWFEHHPWALLGAYYALYDLTYYWMHRAQHAIPWWWALHSMHHSQRQMSCWTNDRGSYLDGILQSMILATVGLLLGVDIAQFALLTLVSELAQNFSHTNVRIGFGRLIEKFLVDPKFHRLHHMKVDEARPTLHNCNFGQVFTLWDRLFGTALYGEPPRPTGVSDPTVDADNGRGLIAMQWYTLKRFWGAFRRPAGWRLGDVGFGDDYEPIPSSYRNIER
jgi:sterol desaturase/sphingolipid hydroxylase (fatty acid hydroxylase superfamily)